MPSSPPRLSPLAAVLVLGVTMSIGYGTNYYSFGVLAARMATDLGWPVTWTFGAFSAALLAGGAAAPWAGKLVDHFGAPTMLAVGSALVGLSLAVAASGGPIVFMIGLVLGQVAATVSQYDAGFACLVQVARSDSSRRITQLTLIAGFASSLFWPVTTGLEETLGWRGTWYVYAALNILVCTPLHLALTWALPDRAPKASAAGRDAPARPAVDQSDEPVLPPDLQRRAMLLLAANFALAGFVLSATLAQLVPLLHEVGLGDSAVLVSTLFGPAQVLVRLMTVFVARGHGPLVPTFIATALLPLAVIVLAFSGGAVAWAVLFAVALGFGSGLRSIVQGTLPLALFGRHGYGARLGRLSSARLVLGAVAPFVFAWMLQATGARVSLLVLAVIGIAGLLSLVEISRLMRLRVAPGGTRDH
jgi:MFS family permease